MRRSLFYWSCFVCLLLAFVAYSATHVSEKNQKKYEALASEIKERHMARKSKATKELPKQQRFGVTKRLYLSDPAKGNLRQQIEIIADRSEIDVSMRKSEARLIETFYDAHGVMQQELYYKAQDGTEYVVDDKGGVKKRKSDAVVGVEPDTVPKEEVPVVAKEEVQEAVPEQKIDMATLEPMQKFRYFEADRAVYDYNAETLIGYGVNFWIYTAKGHDLVKNYDDLWPESSGAATEVTMCHEGSVGTAEFSAENLRLEVVPDAKM